MGNPNHGAIAKHRRTRVETRSALSSTSRGVLARITRTPLRRTALGVLLVAAVLGGSVPVFANQLGRSATTGAANGAPTLALAPTSAQSMSLTPIDSGWTTTRAPHANESNTSFLSATNSQDKTFLKFDTAGLAGRVVASASLRLKVASTTATVSGVRVTVATSDWTSKTLTAQHRPRSTGDVISTGDTRVVANRVADVPLRPDALAALGHITFQLTYGQPFVSTTFYKVGKFVPILSVVFAGSPTTAGPTLSPAPTSPGRPPATASTDLPFVVATSNSSPKKVFAHYFPPYPISLDNKPAEADYYTANYLNPNGESDAFLSSGGLLRDRPIAVTPSSGDFRVANMRREVDQAADSGIDGFTVDVLSLSGQNWDNTIALEQGAVASGRNFVIVPNLDMTASAGKADIPTLAGKLSQLFASPSAYRLGSGEFVLSSFAAERQSPAWWSELQATLASKYSMKIALISVFLNANDANLAAYAPISYALGNWGVRTATTIFSSPDYAAKAHALGVKWMSPVAVQDVRPRSFLYAEAGNTDTLRASWKTAISNDADLVQMTTWNDYSESTSFAPSVNHGYSFLDINSYYASQFKTGTAPQITGDALYVTHRIQLADARPKLAQRLMSPTLSGTSTAPRDTVEVLSFLAAPASITITVGGVSTTYSAPKGESSKTVPLSTGSVSATASRNGSAIAGVTSPFAVVAMPEVQDLEYYAASSRGK